MVELTGTASKENKQQFWNQMQYLMRYENWSKGRASHTYKDRFGVWPRGLIDNHPQEPSMDTRKFVNKKLKAFLRSIGRG
jgi:hypothetical protein